MSADSPSLRDYGNVCAGCGRKLVKKNEPALWFRGHPKPMCVWGICCWKQAG